MALFNYATKEITLKIVYYGPGLSGKTTNIEHLHSTFDPKRRGKLLSLSTEADRTLFFDFLPLEIGTIKGFSIRFQLYTVPGQVRYNSTRKLVLKGADAIVFVADSQQAMKEANIESLQNMKENLIDNSLNIDEIPIVLQFNKRDLPNIVGVDELNADLNAQDYPYFESIATEGIGIKDTFQSITKQLIKHISQKHRIDIESQDLKMGAKPAEEPAEAYSEVSEVMEVEEVLEAEETIPTGEEEAEIEGVPTLEELQKQLTSELEESDVSEAESVPSAPEETMESGELPTIEEFGEEMMKPWPADVEPIVEEIDLVSAEYEETPLEPMKNLENHEEVMSDSALREFEPEKESNEVPAILEEDITGVVKKEGEEESPVYKDESIESIYKAFMSDEEEEELPRSSTPEEEIEQPPQAIPEEKPVPEMEKDMTEQIQQPIGPEEPIAPHIEAFEEPSPVMEASEEVEALKAFRESMAPSRGTEEELAEKITLDRERPFTPKEEPQDIMSEAAKNVILDEINSLSRVVNKMNGSLSTFKSELNVLSDKILEMDRKISEIRSQTSDMQETISDGSGAHISAETLKTIMELKKTIDRAKKKKFWLLFS